MLEPQYPNIQTLHKQTSRLSEKFQGTHQPIKKKKKKSSHQDISELLLFSGGGGGVRDYQHALFPG